MWDDLRFAWRRLRRTPGFTLVAVLTLAVGVGANAAILGIADAVLFRPLPYADPDGVFVLQIKHIKTNRRYTNVALDYLTALGSHKGLSEVGLFQQAPVALVEGPDGTERVDVLAATAAYFRVLQPTPVRGRLFGDGDVPGQTAVLTHLGWTERFGADPALVGRRVTLGTTSYDVVGVLRSDFVFPTSFAGSPALVVLMSPPGAAEQGGTFHPVVRLTAGTTPERAQSEIESLVASIGAADSRRADLTPVLSPIRDVLYPTGRNVTRFLLAAAGLVLLIGCANLASAFLARSRGRQRESAIRSALGASRMQLGRPTMFEALLVGLIGSGVAVVLARLVFETLLPMVPPLVYRGTPVGIDLRVGVLGMLLGLGASVLVAWLPAWRAGRVDVQALLQSRDRLDVGTGARAGRTLLTVQVALAVVLVFGASVAARAFVGILKVPLGFDATNVIGLVLSPPAAVTDRESWFAERVRHLDRRGDVVTAGAIGSAPFSGQTPDEGFRNAETGKAVASIAHALPGYLETIRAPLMKGRTLTWDDVIVGRDATVVSESAARALFGDRDPIGLVADNGAGRLSRVVGVVADVKQRVADTSNPWIYVLPGPRTTMSLLVRTATRRESLLVEIRRDVQRMSPGVPVSARWWSDAIAGSVEYQNPRFQTTVLATFATIGLGLTALGVFGLMALLVSRRTREMGIRTAIGANPASLVRLMLWQSLVPVAVGLVLGLVATRGLARFAEAQLFQIDTRDPWSLVLAVVTVVAAAFVAAYVPARRAGRVDPVVVLRAE